MARWRKVRCAEEAQFKVGDEPVNADMDPEDALRLLLKAESPSTPEANQDQP
jgi:hypothetical protein